MSQKKVYKNTSLLSIIRQETGGRCDQNIIWENIEK